MEKAHGIPLSERWRIMSESDRTNLIKRLIGLEAQLSTKTFPASGGLYLRFDVQGMLYHELAKGMDPARLFCVEPTPGRGWHVGSRIIYHEKKERKLVGPFGCSFFLNLFGRANQTAGTSVEDIQTALSTRESWWARHYRRIAPEAMNYHRLAWEENRKSRLKSDQEPEDYFENRYIPHHWRSATAMAKDDHDKITAIAGVISRRIDTRRDLAQVRQPTLWHTNLHMDNIFVSPKDSSQITAIINWQSQSIGPRFVQVRWPAFLKPPPNYTVGDHSPEIPDGFVMSEEEQNNALLEESAQIQVAKTYEQYTKHYNKITHDAMKVPDAFRKIITCTGESSIDGPALLREALIEITHDWSSFGFRAKFPWSFTEDNLRYHRQELALHKEEAEFHQVVLKKLATDADGWIPPHEDFDEKMKMNRQLCEHYIRLMQGKKSPEEVWANWPFPVGTSVPSPESPMDQAWKWISRITGS